MTATEILIAFIAFVFGLVLGGFLTYKIFALALAELLKEYDLNKKGNYLKDLFKVN